MTFLDIGIIDILDIFVVAFLLYQVYMLIKGTAAIKIFTGIATLYLIWLIVGALKMQLLSTILGQVMGLGVIALLIVFQQEIRKFAIYISNKYLSKLDFSTELIFKRIIKNKSDVKVWAIVKACIKFSKTKTGALIAITRKSELLNLIDSGITLNADTSSILLENIFDKASAMHDGAIIITNDKIIAAKCILPVSDKKSLPENFGLRHRAAYALAQQSDSVIITVSEETGGISLFEDGKFTKDISAGDLIKNLEEQFVSKINLRNA